MRIEKFLSTNSNWQKIASGAGGLSDTKTFTTAEGSHEVVILNGLIQSWTSTTGP